MKHILIATLGDSPVVVTSMFDLLTKQQIPIESITLLHTSGERRIGGFAMIQDVLKGQCTVDPHELSFEDADTEEACFDFLQKLFALLKIHQEQRNIVYLSLAGGRKNMSALMALAAPFYTCVQGLYHVIDKSEATDRANFKSFQELTKLYYATDKTRFMRMMHPNIDDLYLVPIPLKNALRVSESYLYKLHNMTAEQLQTLWNEDPDEADRVQFVLQFVDSHVGPTLKIKLTEQAKKEYEDFNPNLARKFEHCLRSMQFTNHLKETDNKHALTGGERSFPSYVYRKGNTTERPFFHTEPGDIMNYPDNPVDTVVVERFAKHKTRTEYIPSVNVLLSTSYEKGQPLYSLECIVKQRKTIQSVLIVPMGTQPMVATQLYTLLKERERRDIRKVLLLYPEYAEGVYESVQDAKKAFKYEKVECEECAVPELEDVRSQRDCEIYQATLEKTIRREQENFLLRHPGSVIDLALSGGRKGMAALALFSAQRTQLHAVYHTLIANEELERQIAFDVDASEFSGLSQGEQNEKLFLRTYKAREADFRLFTVPIGPLHSN